MRICNFGSLNIDCVYRVPQIVSAGETIASQSFSLFAGGKGANQSVALAQAGVLVAHAGRVGADGRWLIKKLATFGVDTQHILIDDHGQTGQAIIQVDPQAENAIILYPGANHKINRDQIDRTLGQYAPGDLLLLQNEINNLPYLIDVGHRMGMTICFNLAPFNNLARDYPLDLVKLLVVNETEGRSLAGTDDVISMLIDRYPSTELLVTRGDGGVIYHGPEDSVSVPAASAAPVDTTAAGDTLIGYFLAGRLEKRTVPDCLKLACQAAALCVSRHGAMDAIPARHEVERI